MTTTEHALAVGVFTEHALADRAIEALHRAGFRDDQLGYIARYHTRSGLHDDTLDTTGQSAVPGAATGAVGGGIIGGVLGAAVSLLIPGFGPAIAGGVLAATLGGAAIGAVAGGFAGSLVRFGVPEDEARYYQEQLEAGRTLVTAAADTPERYQEAVAILRTCGAYDAGVRNDVDNLPTAADTVDTPMDTAAVAPIMPNVGATPFAGGTVAGVTPGVPVTPATLGYWPTPSADESIARHEAHTSDSEETPDVYDQKPVYTTEQDQTGADAAGNDETLPRQAVTPPEPAHQDQAAEHA